jgi:hypothetical protein
MSRPSRPAGLSGKNTKTPWRSSVPAQKPLKQFPGRRHVVHGRVPVFFSELLALAIFRFLLGFAKYTDPTTRGHFRIPFKIYEKPAFLQQFALFRHNRSPFSLLFNVLCYIAGCRQASRLIFGLHRLSPWAILNLPNNLLGPLYLIGK